MLSLGIIVLFELGSFLIVTFTVRVVLSLISLSKSLYGVLVHSTLHKSFEALSRASPRCRSRRPNAPSNLLKSGIIHHSMLGNHRYLSMHLRPRLTEAEEAELDGREWCVETVLPRTAPEVRHLSSKDVATGARAPP